MAKSVSDSLDAMLVRNGIVPHGCPDLTFVLELLDLSSAKDRSVANNSVGYESHKKGNALAIIIIEK